MSSICCQEVGTDNMRVFGGLWQTRALLNVKVE